MSELYGEPFCCRGDMPKPPARLRGFGGLKPHQRVALRLDQVDAALRYLGAAVTAGGLAVPATTAVRALYEDAAPDDLEDAARRVIYGLHVAIFRTLTAASADLGRAYGLGARARRHLPGPVRAQTVLRAVAPLPAREPALVADRRRDAAPRPQREGRARLAQPLGGVDGERLQAVPTQEDWEREHEGIDHALRRQGELWRGVLSGEKNAVDSLTADTYVEAAGALVRRSSEIVWPFVLRWAPLLLLTVALAVAVIVLLVPLAPSGASQVVASLGTAAAALGISWRTVGASARGVATMLETPLWQSELDAAVGRAITFLPAVPVLEPRADVVLSTTSYLRVAEQMAAPPTDTVTRSDLATALGRRRRLWHRSSREDVDYWLAWASAAGYVERSGDGYLLTDEGQRLARLPRRRPSTVRAELAVGRAES